MDISISNLALLIKKIVSFQGKLKFNTKKPDGNMKKLTNVTKLHDLGWKHKIALQEGVERTYSWYTFKS